ncbi:MAG TPA: sugar phosphate isomerase/epimerase [Candidatus Limnocylindria bacterium]|jgi:sugar phosphate isomerase/epimerase|nr:sugar phosphate isomerase/epimerase [Candidatus Limnocylindria bacterium]
MTRPRMSVCQLCLPKTSFEEDVRIARAIGYDGISIDERKMTGASDAALLELFQASGLRAAACCAKVWSILPLTNFRDPLEPRERIDAICGGLRRLAAFQPTTVFCATGSRGQRTDAEARAIVVEGLRRIAAVAADVGVVVSLEPMTRESAVPIDGPIVSSIDEALALFDDVGDATMRLVVDVWHLHDSPGILQSLERNARRVDALQCCDWREPRGPRDRAMPGEGTAGVAGMMAALESGGFGGWLDLEVFSDELWQLSPEDFMRRGADAIRRSWERRRAPARDQ